MELQNLYRKKTENAQGWTRGNNSKVRGTQSVIGWETRHLPASSMEAEHNCCGQKINNQAGEMLLRDLLMDALGTLLYLGAKKLIEKGT